MVLVPSPVVVWDFSHQQYQTYLPQNELAVGGPRKVTTLRSFTASATQIDAGKTFWGANCETSGVFS